MANGAAAAAAVAPHAASPQGASSALAPATAPPAPPQHPSDALPRPAAARPGSGYPLAEAELVYRHEPTLFVLSLVLSTGFWLVLLLGTLGMALVYALLFFLFYLFAQSGLIAYIKGNAVRITPQQYPDLYQRLEACCVRLGLREVPDTFLLHGGGAFNAFATRFLGRDFLVLFSDVVDALESRPGALNFYLGHELGHVHRGHLTWRPVLLPASFLPLLGPAYMRACESTCDNYGAACCDDLDDAVRGLSALAAGGRRWQDLNLPEYLQQADESSGFWMSFHELIADYPWLVKRVARVAARRDSRDPGLPGRHPVAYLFAALVPRSMAGAGAASVLLMVAVVGIIAAIAIPSLLRARVSANEAATIGDVRTVISAQAAYLSVSGAYGSLDCLAEPSGPGCLDGYPPGQPRFLDAELATPEVRNGYRRSFVSGAPMATRMNPNGLESWCFAAVPAQPGQSGVRSFAGDHTGRICVDASGEGLCVAGALPEGCQPL
jgi:Zn-dependent protease with chaperone function/type II secretory pathway pseudopilin PulG